MGSGAHERPHSPRGREKAKASVGKFSCDLPFGCEIEDAMKSAPFRGRSVPVLWRLQGGAITSRCGQVADATKEVEAAGDTKRSCRTRSGRNFDSSWNGSRQRCVRLKMRQCGARKWPRAGSLSARFRDGMCTATRGRSGGVFPHRRVKAKYWPVGCGEVQSLCQMSLAVINEARLDQRSDQSGRF